MHYFLSQFMTTIVAKKYVRFVNWGRGIFKNAPSPIAVLICPSMDDMI